MPVMPADIDLLVILPQETRQAASALAFPANDVAGSAEPSDEPCDEPEAEPNADWLPADDEPEAEPNIDWLSADAAAERVGDTLGALAANDQSCFASDAFGVVDQAANVDSIANVAKTVAGRQDRLDDRASIIVLEAGQAVEFVPDWKKGQLHKFDTVLGVVSRHVAHLGGVFVRVGTGHDGLLRLAPDEPVPSVGSRVIVTVTRESHSASQTGGSPDDPATADKGPILSRKLSLASRYAVLRPGQWPLRRTILKTLPPLEAERLFAADLEQLQARYDRLLQEAATGPAPRILAAAGDPLLVLAHAYADRLRSIQVEGVDRYRRVEQLLREAAPDLLPRLKLHPPHFTYSLATVHRVGDLARQVRSRQVRLPCGGTLVFDRTEALHVIDVNSGACHGPSPEALADRVNREAVREIARQLRLRNLSGMIVVDLIHQKDPAQREVHAASLREATARDRGAVTVYGYTALRLLELIRKAH